MTLQKPCDVAHSYSYSISNKRGRDTRKHHVLSLYKAIGLIFSGI